MKEITVEEKSKVFALYYGQKIMKRSFPSNNDESIYHVVPSKVVLWHLCVKTLGNITNEDALKVAKIFYWIHLSKESQIQSVKTFLNTNAFYRQSNIDAERLLRAFDYLRSKGYALPAFGHDIPELVTAGVFKLV